MRASHFPQILGLFLAAAALPFAAPAATITVNSTADVAANDGQCTLREAINAAKNDAASGAAAGECAAGSGTDTIAFNVTGTGCNGSGVCTITPGSPLPGLGNSVTIDGYTQTAASVNTLATGTNAVLKIVLSGSGGAADCPRPSFPRHDPRPRHQRLHDRNQGVRRHRPQSPRQLHRSEPRGHCGGRQRRRDHFQRPLERRDRRNRPRRSKPAFRQQQRERQRDPGSGGRIRHSGEPHRHGRGGTSAIPNVYNGGALTISASNTLIGGTADGAGNVISGNTGSGISTGGTNITVQGNLIGTTASGAGALGNSQQGIFLNGAATIGGPDAGEGNVIAHNQFGGVWISAGSAGAKVRGNSIHDNGGGGYPRHRRPAARSQPERSRRRDLAAELSRDHGRDGVLGLGDPEQQGEHDVRHRRLREPDLQPLRLSARGRRTSARRRRRPTAAATPRSTATVTVPAGTEGHGDGDRNAGHEHDVGVLAVRRSAGGLPGGRSGLRAPPPTATASSSRARPRRPAELGRIPRR